MSEQKSIWIINQYAGSPKHGMEFRHYYLAKELVKALEDVYRIDILINAFSLVCKNNPLLKLKLVLVGKGSKEVVYRKLVKELNLESYVLFVGWVLEEHLPPYFSRFDVFANLARSESFGVSVLEAMSCECPVVVASVGGLPEIVSKDFGILVKNCNPENCVMSFQKLIDDYATAKKIGVAGRERVIKLFNWQDTLEKMVSAYNLN